MGGGGKERASCHVHFLYALLTIEDQVDKESEKSGRSTSQNESYTTPCVLFYMIYRFLSTRQVTALKGLALIIYSRVCVGPCIVVLWEVGMVVASQSASDR